MHMLKCPSYDIVNAIVDAKEMWKKRKKKKLVLRLSSPHDLYKLVETEYMSSPILSLYVHATRI